MTDRIVYEDDSVVVLVRAKAKPPAPPGPGPEPEPPPAPPAHVSPLYDLVNLHRASVGAHLVKIDPEAERIAQGWAEEMARTGDYHHNPQLAADMGDPWFALAENIAWTTGDWSTEARAHQLWTDSDPHRRNMEGPAYTHLGVGRAKAAGGKTYWCQVFVDRLP